MVTSSSQSTLPLAEKQQPHLHDDSDVSVYNNTASPTEQTPSFMSFSSSTDDHAAHRLEPDAWIEEKPYTRSLKHLHKYSKSTLPYATTTIAATEAEAEASQNHFNPQHHASSSSSNRNLDASTTRKSSADEPYLDFNPPKGLRSTVSLVKKSVISSVYNNKNVARILALVVFLVFMLLISSSNATWSSLIFGPRHRPVQGVTDYTVYSDSPFFVPDIASLMKPKAGSGGGSGSAGGVGGSKGAPSKNSGSSDIQLKKAPGDYGSSDLTGDKAPHAALSSNDDRAPTVNDAKDTPNGLDSAGAAGAAGVAGVAGAAAVKPTTLAATVFKGAEGATPELIIVLALNPEEFKIEYMERIIANRQRYAKRHGFGLYVRYVTDFRNEYADSNGRKTSWAKLSILRAAFHAFPKANHFWYLDHFAIIANMEINVVANIINPAKLGSLMRHDIPVVYDTDNIRTYKNTQPSDIRFIVTQDAIGLSTTSFILTNMRKDDSMFAKSLIDYWNDPLSKVYYAYDRAETSAVNHIMKWHPAFLSRTAIVPARSLAGYAGIQLRNGPGSNEEDLNHVDGDFVAVLSNCETTSSLACMKELSPFMPQQSFKESS